MSNKEMPLFCDSHAHITSPDLFSQIEEVLSRAKQAGVDTIINIVTDEVELRNSLALSDEFMKIAEKHPKVYTAAAVHPHDAENAAELLIPIFTKAAKEGKLVAIGETGLDYHYTHSTSSAQQRSLRKHLQLALECKLPVIIHCREAFSDLFPILDEEYKIDGRHAPGVLHCFTGTLEEAEKVLERNWFISLSGIITFKKSDYLKKLAQNMPLDRLLIETDSPFLAPQSKRGSKNEPSYLPEIAQLIADLKGISIEEVASATRHNAHTLFSCL
jgi:TatD DNase family protein